MVEVGGLPQRLLSQSSGGRWHVQVKTEGGLSEVEGMRPSVRQASELQVNVDVTQNMEG